jgi:DNA-binding PadR family transcriptional regulator
MLGEFEYLVLSTAARLGDDAYGASIRAEIERLTGRQCSAGALYLTIERLERKGLLMSWMGGATAQRGGRAKRMVRLTAQGRQAAAEFFRTVVNATRGLAWGTRVRGQA